MLDKWNSNPEYNWTMKKNNHHKSQLLEHRHEACTVYLFFIYYFYLFFIFIYLFHITHSNGQLQWGFKALQPFHSMVTHGG